MTVAVKEIAPTSIDCQPPAAKAYRGKPKEEKSKCVDLDLDLNYRSLLIGTSRKEKK